MNVHIVCQATSGEHVIARLARLLTEQTGWTASIAPDPRAEINYLFPYLEWKRFTDFKSTPTAAWFTHRDEAQPGKVPTWHGAAAAVDLRLTSARLYLPELEARGAARLVTPPLDREHFKPGRQVINERPIVGVAGMVYAGGRKGEALVGRLAQARPDVTFKGAGRGWPPPVRTRYYPPEELPLFYQSLDVFVCAATIEGIPLPPLEAMACGVPVVIPRGVGLLDELPDVPGVYRYPAGDYDGMQAAMDAALDGRGDAEALREATARFTAEAWVSGHVEAFEALLNPAREVEPLPEWQGRSGVYVVAYGSPARTCAETALSSWKAQMPDVPCALASDSPLGLEDVFIETPDRDIGGRLAKIAIYDNAPSAWQYILYLDADTEVVADVSSLFGFLADGWELVICTNPEKYALARAMLRGDNADESAATWDAMGHDELIQLNGGVFAFRRCARVEAFFRRWHDEWQRWGKRDQGALLRALYAAPLRVLVLGNQWNTVQPYCPPEMTAGILHFPQTARRYSKGGFSGRLDSPEAFKHVIK